MKKSEYGTVTPLEEIAADMPDLVIRSITDAHPRGGTKHDGGKVDLSILPLAGIEEEAKAFSFGEKKYGRYNYTAGFETSRLVSAALRHIHAYNSGEDLDKESGLSHLGHAKACLSMLIHCNNLGTLTDNRFKGKKS